MIGDKMLNTINDEWLADTEAMLCSNSLTKIVVGFVRDGEVYIGKIKDMPLDFMVRLSKMKNGDLLLKKTVLDAEEILVRKCLKQMRKSE